MADTNPFRKLLHNKPIKQLVKEQDVLAFNRTDTLQSFLNGIGERRLLAAPILGENSNVVGFVDVLDVATYFHRVSGDEAKVDDPSQIHLEDVIDLSAANSYVPSLDINPLSFLLELFALGSHRALILRDEGYVILSQSDVIKVMHGHMEDAEIKPMAELTLEELGLGYKAVKTLNKSATVSDAVALISEHQISALAIVDDEGVLVGNFSASDLRGDFQELRGQFGNTIEDFLGANSPSSLDVNSMTPNKRLNQVLSHIVRNHRHRVWITNEENKPIGVITLTDLCRLVRSFEYNHLSKFVFDIPFKLFVTIHQGKNLLKGDLFSSDPYILVDLPSGDRAYRTKTIQKTLNPVWEKEIFSFIVEEKQVEERIVFNVWDEDKGVSDDPLGSFSVKMKWILDGFGSGSYVPSMTDWYLLRNEKNQGQIEVTFTVQEIHQ